MGSRLGRRIVHFANLPIKVLPPNPPFDSIREFALKTIPSASKIEIRRVLESLYGFQIADVRTLNMEGKKKKAGGYLVAKPDYKKACITLKEPLSISPDLSPIPWIQEAMKQRQGKKKGKAAVVEEEEEEEEGASREPKHWMEERREERVERRGDKRRGFGEKKTGKDRPRRTEDMEKEEGSRFPWSSMRSWRK